MLPGKLGKVYCAECDPKKKGPPETPVVKTTVRVPPGIMDGETMDSGEEETTDAD